jgi:hypothetical protein
MQQISNKQIAAYILYSVGFAASIGGVFYANKKGYGGWGKVGMFILFGAPFNVAAGALAMSAKQEEQMNA